MHNPNPKHLLFRKCNGVLLYLYEKKLDEEQCKIKLTLVVKILEAAALLPILIKRIVKSTTLVKMTTVNMQGVN